MAIRPGRLVQRKMGTVTGVLFNVACAEIDSDNSEVEVAFGFLSIDDARRAKNLHLSKIKLKHLKLFN